MLRTRLAIFSILIVMLLFGQSSVYGSSHGIEGFSETGCTCHDEVAGVDAEVIINGIPEEYQQGETYSLTIILNGGTEASSDGHQGGFNLKANVGTFSSPDDLTYVTDLGEITHGHEGANYRSWVVEWTAPISEEKAEFTIAGNIVDGDHQPSEDDDWAINSYSSESDKLIPDDKIKQLIGVIIVISIFIVPIFLLWKKSR